MRETVRRARRNLKVAVKAAKYLYTVRAALPRYLRWLVAVTIAVKIVTAPLPVDGGVDELLIVVTAALLWIRHRALVRVCWRAASLEV